MANEKKQVEAERDLDHSPKAEVLRPVTMFDNRTDAEASRSAQKPTPDPKRKSVVGSGKYANRNDALERSIAARKQLAEDARESQDSGGDLFGEGPTVGSGG